MNAPGFLNSISDIMGTHLFTVGNHAFTPGSILTFLLILLTAWGISRFLQRMLSITFKRRDLQDEGNLGAVQRLLHYVILVVGIGIGLETVGVQLTALFAAGAVFAVAIGFAMQTILQNFVAGVILLAERAIKPGDVLEVEGMRVKVVSLGIRTTVVRTMDEEDLILPNSMLAQSMVKNYTLRDPLYRVRIPVGVVYGSDMRVVMDTLKKAAGTLPGLHHDREPLVLMTEFGDNSVNFEVSVWTNDPGVYKQTRSRLYEATWWALKEAGVVIAFPQLDVHFDLPVQKSLDLLASGRNSN